jgi:hypothetical protein
MDDQQNILQHWTNEAKKMLLGKRIMEVRYLDDKEMQMLGWNKRPICFKLDDGTFCFLATDDEGNDGGSLFVNENDVIPSL